jgi:hypothetical protein
MGPNPFGRSEPARDGAPRSVLEVPHACGFDAVCDFRNPSAPRQLTRRISRSPFRALSMRCFATIPRIDEQSSLISGQVNR